MIQCACLRVIVHTIPWLGRAFRDAGEYLDAARSVITNPSAKRVMYYHGENLGQPRLGYLLERNGKVFLAAVGDDGTIRTFHFLDHGWSALRIDRTEISKKVVFDKLFEIDSVSR